VFLDPILNWFGFELVIELFECTLLYQLLLLLLMDGVDLGDVERFRSGLHVCALLLVDVLFVDLFEFADQGVYESYHFLVLIDFSPLLINPGLFLFLQ